MSSNTLATSGIYDNKVEDEGMAREGREQSPSSVEEIREAIKGKAGKPCKCTPTWVT